MKKLISMKEFILEQKEYSIENLFKIKKYANFLNQPLKKGMFVPCDEEDNILQEPKKENYTDNTGFVNNAYFIETNDYQKAKERVIFDGFELTKEKNGLIKIEKKTETFYIDLLNNKFYYVDIVHWKSVYTIEDLINYNLELTENFKL